MMDEIDLFVKQSYSPEICALFYRAFDMFEELYSDVDYNAPYIAILMDSANEESGEVSDLLYARLKNDVIELLRVHEIEVSDSAELRNLIEVLEGIVTLQDYDDRNAILTIIEAGADTMSTFAELIGLVTTLEEHSVFSTINGVKPELFTTLVEYLDPNNDVDLDDDSEVIDQALLKKVKVFVDYCGDKSTYAIQLVRGGYAIGAQFDHYATVAIPYLDTISDDEQYAFELLAFLYLSKDSYTNPLQYYQEHSAAIISDDAKVTRVYVKIKNRIADFESFYTNKIVSEKGVVNA